MPGGWYVGHGEPDQLGPTLRRIAERAFRHGVERTKYELIQGWQENVQPAPTEEKCACGCGHPKTCEGCLNRDESWRQRVGKWGHVCTNACHLGLGHSIPDRRSGSNRRKP